MLHRAVDAAESTSAPGDRGFWAIFTAAWLAYLGLHASTTLGAEGLATGPALWLALANSLPPAALSVILGLRRRDLLRPERSLVTTTLLQVGMGIVFAVASAAAITALTALMGLEEVAQPRQTRVASIVVLAISMLFLYVILAGFLMWAESVRRVHESRVVAAREAMLRAQAEARAIRAQFNPHFVFNTLHSLILLVRADPGAAERAIEDVGALIRYASVLQRMDVDLVPLAKELEVARRYVALEKLRLEDRLGVEWSLEADPETVAVPAFALQTLIENAVRHGLETRVGGGTIRISIRAQAGGLSITVADDGKGADPEAVSLASGHGLQLLARRLEALYGGEASLSWSTTPGDGFTATLRFPARAPERSLRAPWDLAVTS